MINRDPKSQTRFTVADRMKFKRLENGDYKFTDQDGDGIWELSMDLHRALGDPKTRTIWRVYYFLDNDSVCSWSTYRRTLKEAKEVAEVHYRNRKARLSVIDLRKADLIDGDMMRIFNDALKVDLENKLS